MKLRLFFALMLPFYLSELVNAQAHDEDILECELFKNHKESYLSALCGGLVDDSGKLVRLIDSLKQTGGVDDLFISRNLRKVQSIKISRVFWGFRLKILSMN